VCARARVRACVRAKLFFFIQFTILGQILYGIHGTCNLTL